MKLIAKMDTEIMKKQSTWCDHRQRQVHLWFFLLVAAGGCAMCSVVSFETLLKKHDVASV